MNEKNIKILFGNRVKELRLKKKLTQEQLAEAIDIAERNVSKIECGENFPRAEKIAKLSLALGVSAQELFNFEHFQEEKKLFEETVKIIKKNPEKLPDIYKIIRAITS